MNLRPTRIAVTMHFICSFVRIFLINFSCSKDSDTLSSSTAQEETVSLIEQDSIDDGSNTEPDEDEPKGDTEDNRGGGTEDCSTSASKANESGLKWFPHNIMTKFKRDLKKKPNDKRLEINMINV